MISSKKAIESYLLIIVIISFVISILLFFIIQLAYQSDSPLCQDMSFTYEVVCKQPSSYVVNVQNTGSIPITFEFNGNILDSYYVAPGTSNRINVVSDATRAVGVPIVLDAQGDAHFCISKQERTNVEVLGSC